MKHLSEIELRKFYDHALEEDKYMEALTHMAECEECSSKFADMVQNHLKELPSGFKQKVAVKTYKKRKRVSKKEYYWYCVRTFAACAASLLIILSVGNIPQRQIEDKTQKFSFVESLDKGMDQMFGAYDRLEEKLYDKEEK